LSGLTTSGFFLACVSFYSPFIRRSRLGQGSL
jgi:hypothetical protein